MDCPECGGPLASYVLQGREASVCERCGWVGIEADHHGEGRVAESWGDALGRFYERHVGSARRADLPPVAAATDSTADDAEDGSGETSDDDDAEGKDATTDGDDDAEGEDATTDGNDDASGAGDAGTADDGSNGADDSGTTGDVDADTDGAGGNGSGESASG